MQYRARFIIAALTLATSIVAQAQQPTAKPSETRLTFLSHRTGHNLLYTSHPDGTNAEPIFGGPIDNVPSLDNSYSLFREPHWTRQSPDGEYFASWVYETGKPYSEFQGQMRPMLWVGDIARTWTRIVNPDCHEEFAWSPNSNQIAFSILSRDNYQGSLQKRPETTEVFLSGIDGSNHTGVLEQNGIWIVLDWSPDGKRLLISRRSFAPKPTSELFEFQLQDAFESRKQTGYDPEWTVKTAPMFLKPINQELDGLQPNSARYSPTRNELAIEAFDPENMYAPNLVANDELGRGRMMRLLSKILVLNLGTGISHIVADYDDGIRGPICWSPDGNEILFSRYLPKDDDREKFAESEEHGLSIWSVGRDGTNARFVTTGLSPDFPHLGSQNGK